MGEGILHAEHFTAMNIVLLAVAAIIILGFLVLIFKSSRANKKIPLQTESACVSEIRHSVSGNAKNGQMGRNMNLGMPLERNMVIFRLDNGDLIEFSLDDHQLQKITVQQRGQLTWQGSKYISFTT